MMSSRSSDQAHDAPADATARAGLVKGVKMGQATVDLTESASSTAPSGAASADDLLSQLAGEEIDRLLAEADAKPGAETENAPVPVAAQAETDLSPTSETIRASPELTSQINEALEVEKGEASPTVASAAEPVPEIETATNAAERAALAAPTETPSSDAFDDDEPEDPSLPIYLRPLQWLSAPLSVCSDPVRELIGKLAIITLLNALAVLIYVTVFRK